MRQLGHRWLNYLPALLAGLGAAALVTAFALGYFPLTGILLIDTMQTSVMFIDSAVIKGIYIGEKALLAFFSTSFSVYWGPKIISLFNIGGLRESYSLKKENRDLQKEVEQLQLHNARLGGRIDAISHMTHARSSMSNAVPSNDSRVRARPGLN